MGVPDRDWYRDEYRPPQHLPSTIWERENRARINEAKARRRRRWLRPLRRIPGLIVLAALVAVLAQGGYYIGHGLNAEDTLRAIGYDWQYYAARVIPGSGSGEGAGGDQPTANGDALETVLGAVTPTPTAAANTTPEPTSTPLPTPTPRVLAASDVATTTPNATEVDKAIDDFINRRISREEAVDLLGEERVARLEALLP